MKHLLSVCGALAFAALFVGCGGGGSSTENVETPASVEHHHSATKPKTAIGQSQVHQEQREQRARQQQQGRERQEARFAKKQRQAKQRRHESRDQKKKEKASVTSQVASITAEEFSFFTGTDLSNWELAYSICAVTPEKQLAREFHTEQNFGAIGHAYGAGYREPFNIAAEEGCMAALLDSKAEREAAFELMEANE